MRPMNLAARPSVGSMPVKKSRLPVCTASTYVPNGSGGAGSFMPSSFSRCSAPAWREPSQLTNRIVEFVSIFFPSVDLRRSSRRLYGPWRVSWSELLDAKRLLHGVALIPDVHIEPAEFGRPLACERVDTLRCDAINVVIEECPWIVLIQWVQSFAGFGRSQRRRRRLLHVIVELGLNVHVSMSAGARKVAANERIPIHFSDFLDLREVARYVLCECKATPRHPAGEYHIDDHQDSLRRRIDENVSRLVRVAVVGKFEHLITDPQRVLVRKSNRRQRPIRIRTSLQQPQSFFM